jgi:hypothetical protein
MSRIEAPFRRKHPAEKYENKAAWPDEERDRAITKNAKTKPLNRAN